MFDDREDRQINDDGAAGAEGAPSVSQLLAALDDAGTVAVSSGLSALQKLRLTADLAKVRIALQGAPDALQRLRLAKRLAEIRAALGVVPKAAVPTPAPSVISEADKAEDAQAAAEDIAAGSAQRMSTSRFFEFDPNRKHSQRRRDNAEAMDLLKMIEGGAVDANALTDDQKMTLAKYSGTGGALIGADGKKGSTYEYYTPKPIAEGVWNLLQECGFTGGMVSDPASGVGVFGATAPTNAAIDAVELNETSGRINELVNGGPGYRAIVAPFEQVAAATPDEVYDAVVTNVPFGDVDDRGGNQFKDTKYRGEPLQNYFVLRSLEKLRPRGLAAFIVPPRCVSGKGGREAALRQAVSYMAEFLGAYRLPNSVFGTASADTITDVVVFRKFSRPVLDKIAELREQAPAKLIEANVMWEPFLSGDYFKVEGRRFVLGEFVAKDPNKFRDVDRVISDGSVTDIARLLRKFGASRVNWDVLDAAETEPLSYAEGDTINHAGQTLRLQNGVWEVLRSEGADDAAARLADDIARLTTPLGAVNSGATYLHAVAVRDAMLHTGRALDVPEWLRSLLYQLQRVEDSGRAAAWSAAIVGLGIDQAMHERQEEEAGFNYLAGYPELSEAMKRVEADAKRPPSVLEMSVKTAMRKVAIFYSKADGFSAVWRGDIAEPVDLRDAAQRFEAERYAAGGSAWVPLDKAREALGEGFDPLSNDDWCLSPDGKSVAKSSDFYVGNVADFMALMDADIAAATDNSVRDKLLRQKLNAHSRIVRTDPTQMQFNLFSPFVTIEEKAEFLRRFLHPGVFVQFSERTGEPEIGIKFAKASPDTPREKLLQRFCVGYMKNGSVTLGGAEVGDEKAAMAWLRRTISEKNAQFNSWVKSNPVIMGRLATVANDPQRLYFRQDDDESPLTIPGLHPDWKTHGYQCAYVRKTGREFSGINGFGVGLGKTSTALIAVQHAQAIGSKRKTIIVVPNSVMSNWRKEAGRVYASTDDCLYVGLREDKVGGFEVKTSAYDADLNRILENRHAKVFMTYECFGRLRLRESTAQAYDAYLASVDASYAASDDKKADEKTKSKRAALIEALTTAGGKSAAAPFFEDLGVDSLIFDEGHMLKNSRATVDFKGGKFLSLADPSGRGLDAQAKAWCVRKDQPRKDGVIVLTATPITNSPLEVYSMLALAIGEQRVNDMMLGASGSDEFMEVMCRMESMEDETLDGKIKDYRVFTGLDNVGVLRNAMGIGATIKTAEDVGAQIVMPQADETATSVRLDQATVDQLEEYKQAFRFAIDTMSGKQSVGGSQKAAERVMERFGEPLELVAHPFNLISKMSLLIADPELDQRASFYTFTVANAEKAADVVGRWNAKAPIEERSRKGPHTDDVAVVGTKKVKDGDDVYELLKIQARAKIDGQRIVLDTMDAQTIAAFDDLADKAGLDLDVSIPPKLAALIANVQAEEANPRGRVSGSPTGRVRQLIFCDVLPMHGKIKRLLVKHCGVAASAIAIITGKVNGRPDQILEVQEGFNDDGEGNRYRFVIANEKAEVGINLQKGTQAIHHLTLGWTPDSLTQRNGRGARQGNETERVTVYHYDADGTFDAYKRTMVNKKADWIDAVLSEGGENSVAVSGGLTRAQQEALINSVGVEGGMSRVQAEIEAAEKLSRETSTRGRQAVNMQTMLAQRRFIDKYKDAKSWAADKLAALILLRDQAALLGERIANPKATASAVLKNQGRLAEIQARMNGLRDALQASVTITKEEYSYGGYGAQQTKKMVTYSIDDFMRAADSFHLSRGEKRSDVAAEIFSGRKNYGYVVTVDEDSEIGNEWQSELDQARAMVDASRDDFARQASEAGGYSLKVLDRIEAGEAVLVGGNILCAGAFITASDGFLYVTTKTRTGMMAFGIDAAGETKTVSSVDAMRGDHALVLPGGQGYDEAVTRAAQIEDAIAAKGAVSTTMAGLLYSSVCTDVAQRRTATLMVRYRASGYGRGKLPAPYFPLVAPQPAPDGTTVIAMISRQQADIVASTSLENGSLFFTAANTAAVEEESYSGSSPQWWPAVIEFAVAHGVKVTWGDWTACVDWAGGTVPRDMRNKGASAFDAAVTRGAATEEELSSRLVAWLTDQAFPSVDLITVPAFTTDPAEFLRLSNPYEAAEYRMRIEAIRAAEAKGENPEPAPALEPDPQPKAEDDDGSPVVDLSDPLKRIGIIGDTRRWKEEIKSSSLAAGAGRAIWDGDGGPTGADGKPSGCWNTTVGGWNRLIKSYPSAEQHLQVWESSGKMSYGRRGRR